MSKSISLVIAFVGGLFLLDSCEHTQVPDSREGSILVTFRRDTTVIGQIEVKEFENEISLANAAYIDSITHEKFSGIDIGFKGDFEGVADNVALWIEYGDGFFATNLLNNWHVMGIPPVGGNPHDKPSRGRVYAFVLDTDNNNRGSGVITFKSKEFEKTLEIDASKNTVLLEKAAYFDITGYPSERFEISAEGKFYHHYNYILGWFSILNDSKYHVAESFWGGGSGGGYDGKMIPDDRAYFFVPRFE